MEVIQHPYYEREKTRAIMIGIDEYEDEAVTPLKGAKNDVLTCKKITDV